MHERDLPFNILTQHYFTGERRLQKIQFDNFWTEKLVSLLMFLYNCLCLLSVLVHRMQPFSSPKKSEGNSSSYPQNQGDSVKHSRQKLVQMAKYCLPQIKYLLIHVFLINFRQRNFKLVLLKEFKPIILDFASKNLLFCECRKFIGNV